MGSNLPNHTAFSEEVGKINEKVLGEESFVVKKAKNTKQKLFNAITEARVLGVLQGCKFLPYVYGVLTNTSLVMEIVIGKSDCKV